MSNSTTNPSENLATSCSNLRLEYKTLGGSSVETPILRAECRDSRGRSVDSSLPLDLVLGNLDGKFTWGVKYFSRTATDIRLEGTVLHATLRGARGQNRPTSVDLAARIANMDGALELTPHYEPLATSCTDLRLEHKPLLGAKGDVPVLRAKCRNPRGDYVDATLPLDLVLGNDNGRFVWGLKNFSQTAKDATLDGTVLSAQLQNSWGTYQRASVDLAARIRNAEGRLDVEVLSAPLSSSCTDLRLENRAFAGTSGDAPVLCARCRDPRGAYVDSVLPLDLVLGNIDGTFEWGWKHFSLSARNVRLDGTVLRAELRSGRGDYRSAEVDLAARIRNRDGRLEATRIAAVAAVRDEASEKAMISRITEFVEFERDLFVIKNEDGSCTFAIKKDTSVEWNAGYSTAASTDAGGNEVLRFEAATAMQRETFLDTFDVVTVNAEAAGAVFSFASDKGRKIEQYDVKVVTAAAGASAESFVFGGVEIPKYAGVEAKVNLIEAKGAGFEANLGVGVGTDVGIKDDSLDVHLAGCGFTIGRKVGISVFGSGISFDFGVFF